ncbi:hypothetical protein ACTHRK_18740 [Dietzia cercidiphylli]|uniref:hypothetical protein n=1 Tax=Dietzia cercidiphylli TaxID=498199 RepID=UPI003F808E46
MPRVDTHAQGFVAAVFGHHAIGQLAGEQECESVPGLGSTDPTRPPRQACITVDTADR